MTGGTDIPDGGEQIPMPGGENGNPGNGDTQQSMWQTVPEQSDAGGTGSGQNPVPDRTGAADWEQRTGTGEIPNGDADKDSGAKGYDENKGTADTSGMVPEEEMPEAYDDEGWADMGEEAAATAAEMEKEAQESETVMPDEYDTGFFTSDYGEETEEEAGYVPDAEFMPSGTEPDGSAQAAGTESILQENGEYAGSSGMNDGAAGSGGSESGRIPEGDSSAEMDSFEGNRFETGSFVVDDTGTGSTGPDTRRENGGTGAENRSTGGGAAGPVLDGGNAVPVRDMKKTQDGDFGQAEGNGRTNAGNGAWFTRNGKLYLPAECYEAPEIPYQTENRDGKDYYTVPESALTGGMQAFLQEDGTIHYSHAEEGGWVPRMRDVSQEGEEV